ncbi:MAG: transglycosylase domain-containing protein [Pseudomonadota bacterium]
MKRFLFSLSTVMLLLFAAVFSFLYGRCPDYGRMMEECRSRAGVAITDRNGVLLRVLPDDRGQFSAWRTIDQFPLHLKEAVICAEDHRFPYHYGFDPLAVIRAAYTNVRSRRTISGASTITQQTVRLITPRPRTFKSKVIELVASVKMESRLSKDQILELYLNLSPMGGNIRGAGLASLVYFGKEVGSITVPEAAVVACVPRSPARFNPRRDEGRRCLLPERNRLLDRMAERKGISPRRPASWLGSPLTVRDIPLPFEAPHLVDYAIGRGVPSGGRLLLTADIEVQRSLERTLKAHRKRLAERGIRQAAAMVASVDAAEVSAMVGSLEYGPTQLGYNNAAIARRSVGSCLKPFLYASALERGCNASEHIPDTFMSYRSTSGDYLPYNADRRFYGPVSIRTALGNSLNISAVKVLASIGTADFYDVLQQLGIVDDNSPGPAHYGLGLAVGNMETSLFRLVQAFATLCRGGLFKPLGVVVRDPGPSFQVFSPEAAYVVTHMLSDPTARLLTFGNPVSFDFPFPVAVKTGTSTNYRDCWMIACTRDHVIGVWVGNFDGSPNNGATAAVACAPIVYDVIMNLYGSAAPRPFQRPKGVREHAICWMSGKTAGPNCPYASNELFIGSGEAPASCDLRHDSDHTYHLSAPYSHWLHRREAEQGRGRFSLISPQGPPPSNAVSDTMRMPSATHALDLSRTPAITIVSPHTGDRFVLTPDRPNRIRFQAMADPLVPFVTWFMDGVEVARTEPPYEFFWEPTRGQHTVDAVTPQDEGVRTVFQVE